MRLRKEKELIPLERSKKVIRISPRIKEKKNYPAIVLLSLLAGLCLVYCVSIGLMMTGSKFFLVWGLAAVFFGGWAVLLAKPGIYKRIPGQVRVAVGVLVLVGILFVGALSILIWSVTANVPREGADYVIVLGAQWRADGPSTVLRYRLDTALEYLEANPHTKVIVTGCKGPNEPISEAEGMAGYLTDAGIAKERVILEEQAANTYENLFFSRELGDVIGGRVVVVTNDFHLYRALALGRAMGYEEMEGLAAPSHITMLPQNLLRECLALVKEFLIGNI